MLDTDFTLPPTCCAHETLHVCKMCVHVFFFFRRAMAADLDVVNLFIIAGGTLAIPILAFIASVLLWPSALIKVYYW